VNQESTSKPLPGEAPWIPAPEAPPLLWPRKAHEPGPAKWTRYTLKARQLCTTCVLVLLDHRKDPYPRQPGHPNRATRVRTVGEGKGKQQTWHCSPHGTELEEQDRNWVRSNTIAREHANHMARGRR